MSKQILETLFESKTKVKLLKFMFRNSAGYFTLEEIVDRIREDKKTVRYYLVELETIGLIRRERLKINTKEKQSPEVFPNDQFIIEK